MQSIHCACAILGQVNDLLGNKFKSAVLTRLAGESLCCCEPAMATQGIGAVCVSADCTLQCWDPVVTLWCMTGSFAGP